MIYFDRNQKDASCAGFHNYLTKNLELIAFLGDVLFSFQRFQNLQSNRLTIISMKSHITAIIKCLAGMESTQLPGGFENKLGAQVSTGLDAKKYLKSIKLQAPKSGKKFCTRFNQF